MNINKNNFKIISLEGTIGSGKTTATSLIKDILKRPNSNSYKEILKNINDNYGKQNAKKITKITTTFLTERTAVSPFLQDFYDIMNIADSYKHKPLSELKEIFKNEAITISNKKQFKKLISQKTANLEAIFFLDMIQPIRQLEEIINNLEDDEFRIIIMDRTALSVINFTYFYRQEGLINKKDYKWLQEMFNNNLWLLRFLTEYEFIAPLFIDVPLERGFENVKERDRKSEKTMTFDYYKKLYSFYEKTMKPSYEAIGVINSNKKPIIIENINSKEIFKQDLIDFLKQTFENDYLDEILPGTDNSSEEK